MVSFGLLFGHQLHLQQPAGIVAALYGLEEVALVRLAVFGYYFLGFFVGKVLDALQCPRWNLTHMRLFSWL